MHLQIKQSVGNMHHLADSTTSLCHDRVQECECKECFKLFDCSREDTVLSLVLIDRGECNNLPICRRKEDSY